MKKQYKILKNIIIAEFAIVFILSGNFKFQSWIGNAIGGFAFFLPIQILLFLLSKDEQRTDKTKICCKIAFWHINICYILGAIATLLNG